MHCLSFQIHNKCGLAWLADHGHSSAVFVNCGLNKIQTQANACLQAGGSGLQTAETLEQPFDVLRGDTRALVCDANVDLTAAELGAQSDQPSRRRELEGIAQQIGHRSGQGVEVPLNPNRLIGQVKRQSQCTGHRQGVDVIGHLVQQGHHIQLGKAVGSQHLSA